jgi:hypothetical protein
MTILTQWRPKARRSARPISAQTKSQTRIYLCRFDGGRIEKDIRAVCAIDCKVRFSTSHNPVLITVMPHIVPITLMETGSRPGGRVVGPAERPMLGPHCGQDVVQPKQLLTGGCGTKKVDEPLDRPVFGRDIVKIAQCWPG